MREADFRQFEAELLQRGLAPAHVRRTVQELREHMDDLVSAALLAGDDLELAQQRATESIGELGDISLAMQARPELRCWAHRFPRIAVIAYPLACLALLPAMPVLAGVAHAPWLARWATCVLLGGAVTATMLLVLQLSIHAS